MSDKTYTIGTVIYKVNPNGAYALYLKDERTDTWRESATVTNEMLLNSAPL